MDLDFLRSDHFSGERMQYWRRGELVTFKTNQLTNQLINQLTNQPTPSLMTNMKIKQEDGMEVWLTHRGL